MGQNTLPNQGVVKRDWVATGRIDFATRLNSDAADADQPNEFKLLIEEPYKAAECLLMALSGHPSAARQCPLLGVKRTSRKPWRMSAFDPKRT
jgi:hypothetical protein